MIDSDLDWKTASRPIDAEDTTVSADASFTTFDLSTDGDLQGNGSITCALQAPDDDDDPAYAVNPNIPSATVVVNGEGGTGPITSINLVDDFKAFESILGELKVTNLGNLRNKLHYFRRIYESTLIANIQLVDGGASVSDPQKTVGFETAKDEFYEHFTNGTLPVYYMGGVEGVFLGSNTCGRAGHVVSVPRHSNLGGEEGVGGGLHFVKTDCILGYVFQNDAVFRVRRKYPDLSESLEVSLECNFEGDGFEYDAGDAVYRKTIEIPSAETEYSFIQQGYFDTYVDRSMPTSPLLAGDPQERVCSIVDSDAYVVKEPALAEAKVEVSNAADFGTKTFPSFYKNFERSVNLYDNNVLYSDTDGRSWLGTCCLHSILLLTIQDLCGFRTLLQMLFGIIKFLLLGVLKWDR